MYSLARLGIGLAFLALWLESATADEPAKTQFKTVQLDTEDGGRFDWSKADFLEALKGAEGWELVATSDHAALFRKPKDGPKWEYKAVKAKNSPFAAIGNRETDTDAFGLILDRMAADGYTPCGVNTLGEYTLFKRAKDTKPTKTEFKTILWADVIKTKTAPAERWKDTQFIETINKHGTDGWELSVCNISAAVFQKSEKKWEYKTVKVTKSPLTFLMKGEDDEAATFILILEGLEAKDWKPCACGDMGQQILLKRELKAEPKQDKK